MNAKKNQDMHEGNNAQAYSQCACESNSNYRLGKKKPCIGIEICKGTMST